jgi:hypothetical protein
MKYVLILLFIIFPLTNFALIINIPDDQPTIQAGIDVAVDGDTILVQPGTYVENINYNGKNITVASLFLTTQDTTYISQTLIDGNQDGSVVTFESGEDSTAVLTGLTITNGESDCGGGVLLYYSDAKIKNNIIIQNLVTPAMWPSTSYGGGICISHGAPKISKNQISNNVAYASGLEVGATGGGIYIFRSNTLISNNLICGNSALSNSCWATGGIETQTYTNDIYIPIIQNNTIAFNQGRGLRIIKNAITKNNIISENSTEGILVSSSDFNGEILHNNVWGNDENFVNCPPGIGDTSWGFNINGTACDSCFNISEDPLFVSNQDEDFFLSQLEAGQSEQSPCVDAGSGVPADYDLENYTTRTDLICDEGIVDMGFHYPGFIPQDTEDEYITKLLKYYLSNYPNPFNPQTTISFQLSENGDVNLSIYNIKGQKVKTIVNEKLEQGLHQIIWDGKNDKNQYVASGVYFYKLEVNNKNIAIKKCLLLK